MRHAYLMYEAILLKIPSYHGGLAGLVKSGTNSFLSALKVKIFKSWMRLLLKLNRISSRRSLKLHVMAASASSNAKSSARVYLQVLGTDTKDTSPSLFIFADSQR